MAAPPRQDHASYINENSAEMRLCRPQLVFRHKTQGIKKLQVRVNSYHCMLQLALCVRFGVSSSRVICSPPNSRAINPRGHQSHKGPCLAGSPQHWLQHCGGHMVPELLESGHHRAVSCWELGNIKDTSIPWTPHSNISMCFRCLLLLCHISADLVA